ncbi:shikimate kinase [Bacillus sp. FJAT-27445]|uniref:shikimate kinase n=1 Tax=Bacillus sp. FJAT-27445 TaxID=1679166 RepID=UPI000743BCB3|nr:shikimate kinase [Bacillus sp. FJAT-27445]
MKTIFLIGFMGSGKSTVGRLLGELLGMEFLDTDVEIEKQEGKSINEIFGDNGEKWFRDLETAALETMPERDTVVSTGGGAIQRGCNRKLMKEKGTVIFLDTPAEEILVRLKGDKSRPLLQGNKEQEVRDRLAGRMPFYLETADICISTSGKTPAEIAEELISSLKERGLGHTC